MLICLMPKRDGPPGSAGYHGEMDYMAKHGMKRARPVEPVPGTQRVISARMPYLPARTDASWRQREHAWLADRIQTGIGPTWLLRVVRFRVGAGG